MCDFEDFGDDFEDDGDYMGEDQFGDEFTDNMESDPFEEPDTNGPGEDDPDDFTARDAFFVGSIFGNAYEEGLDQRKRRQLLRKKQIKRDPSSD